MNKIFEMKQERAKIVAQMREIMDRYDDSEMSAEDKAAYEKAEKDFDTLNARIEAREKQIERERKIGEVHDDKNGGIADDRRMEMFARALTGDNDAIAKFRDTVDYTLGTDATAGNITAPQQFVDDLIKGLDDLCFMRSICHKTPTLGAAQSMGFPYMAASMSDAAWTGEASTPNEEQTLEFGRREFRPIRLVKLIKLSQTLTRHSNMVVNVVRGEIARVIAEAQENAYLNGTGSGQPLGIFAASANGVPTTRDIVGSNTDTEISADTLFDAKYALKEQYLRKARWIMHRDAVKMVAKLKDSENRYIWQESMVAGQPDRLLGIPVHMSEFAPNTFAASSYVAVLGNFDYYWICDADALELKVLRELYAEKNQIGYLANYFGDGMPVLGEAFVRVKTAAASAPAGGTGTQG